LWTNAEDEVLGSDGQWHTGNQETIWRWREAYQNDFAARMLWSVTRNYKDANHAPSVRLNGTDGLAPVELTACPGQPVELCGEGSTDPDGDKLSYRWIKYREASGLFAPDLKLSEETGERTTATIGDTAGTDQFTPPTAYRLHVILEATDSGKPQLVRYRRAVITVPGAGFNEKRPCAVTPRGPVH
jgi:hypothetical protein